MRLSAIRYLACVVALLLVACGGGRATPTSAPSPVTPTAVALSTVGAPSPATAAASVTPSSRPLPATATAAPTATATATPTATATVTPLAPPVAAVAPAPCPGAIAWDAAGEHVGQIVTVRGPVVDAAFASASRGQPTFLNIGKGYPDPGRFTVVIWIPNRDNFPAAPEELYRGRMICVTGEVTLYNGLPEMEIIGPEDIVVT